MEFVYLCKILFLMSCGTLNGEAFHWNRPPKIVKLEMSN